MNVRFYDTTARYYDGATGDFTDDLALYSTLAKEIGGPVLDMGCGTGRVVLHLAQEGHRVTGLEKSEAMLARARRKLDGLPHLKSRVTLVQGDVLDAALSALPALAERFRLILVSYNVLTHFNTQADQITVLRHLRDLLADDGVLVIDLPNAGEAYHTQNDSALILERTFTNPESGHMVMMHSISEVDRAAQLLHVTWIYDEIADDGTVRRTVAPLRLRYVFPGEMALMLDAAGLRRIQLYGDFACSPFEDGCPHMIVLAQKQHKATS